MEGLFVSTNYHAKYFAHELTRQTAENGVEKLSRSLFDANVDLNPHQIEAALFAFRSPLSKGVLIADEVGLGKTIEAGLVLCQYWAERKRKLLIICPASLRKQWSMELEEKFNLPNMILESKTFNELYSNGNSNPFDQEKVIITSYHFANRKKEEIRLSDFHLVVIDEAHKLRNVYRNSNKLGKGIKWAIKDTKKLLLSATPLQNSLLELYGLSTLIDDHLFGDIGAFRAQYMGSERDLSELKERLKRFTHRTLRSQVQEYIKYTERKAYTTPFIPTDEEQALYQAISDFLLRDDTYAIPQRQKVLTTLILRKLLASSSQAVAGTLQTMKERLEGLLKGSQEEQGSDNAWIEEIVVEDEMEYDIFEENEGDDALDETITFDKEKIQREIDELDRYAKWAGSIQIDSKTKALLTAIETGFNEMEKMGANRKALIFTESKRTQEYLRNFLEVNGFSGRVVIFNGTNTDDESKRIFHKWLEVNRGTNLISGSKTADKRQALIDYFLNEAEIMIATESAAEGVNLQFCSLLINYDLPWNPQRIEQRIGRCHRYGQKHDVVVINFINKRNDADTRVYELLRDKFNLFTGVLGASDEVLGTIESGVDFEKRILEIYQECRSPEEITSAFRKLQNELESQIKSKMDDTKKSLLEHFDEDVYSRLKFHLDETNYQLDRFSKMFWALTSVILKDRARFSDNTYQFELIHPIEYAEVNQGKYQLITKDKEKQTHTHTHQIYRLSHPLGEYVLGEGQKAKTPNKEVVFNITNHPYKISLIEQLVGESGYLTLTKLTIDSYQREEYLLFSGLTDNGKIIDQEICEKLFNCYAQVIEPLEWSNDLNERLKQDAERHIAATVNNSLENNNRFFQEEREHLEKWADDLMIAAEKELADTKIKIKELKRKARHAKTIEEQHNVQKEIKEMERKQRRQRQQIFDLEDEIGEKRDELIDELEKQLVQKTTSEELFTIRWSVI